MKSKYRISIKQQLRRSVWFNITIWLVMLINSAGLLAYGLAIGYKTNDPDLVPGMVAAISLNRSQDGTYVERASIETEGTIVGVAVDPANTIASVSTSGQQVFIESTGGVKAYVLDINGSVLEGDKLTLSPINGMLMKYDSSIDPGFLATATENFDDSAAKSITIKTFGGTKQAKLQKINVTLSISSQDENRQKSLLQRLGQSVLGKEVTDLQVVIALIIFLVVMITEGSIVYGAVSSGIISLGRNPLAKKVIRSEMIRVLGVVVVVLAVGMASIYAVLSI